MGEKHLRRKNILKIRRFANIDLASPSAALASQYKTESTKLTLR